MIKLEHDVVTISSHDFEEFVKVLYAKPKADCVYYNWGGTNIHNSYPRELGARCEYHDKFFSRRIGELYPDCSKCQQYQKKGLQ